jgi:hypothetical protein
MGRSTSCEESRRSDSFYVRNRGKGGLGAECSKPAAKGKMGREVNGRRDRKASSFGGQGNWQPEECPTELMESRCLL